MRNEYGSHMAPKGNYGRPIANNPGEGCGKLGGSPGAYATASARGPSGTGAHKGSKPMNRPGKGSGHMGNRPMHGKKGYTGHSGAMNMGNND